MSDHFKKNGYSISTDKSKLNAQLIYDFLLTTYWAHDRSFEQIKIMLEKAICFGVYHADQQIGFARVVTDYSVIAYLGDVFILPEQRSRGLGRWLLETIFQYDQFLNIRTWLLATKDMHDLYRKFGFINHPNPEKLMVRKL